MKRIACVLAGISAWTFFGFAGCKGFSEKEVTVVTPDGAPALALAKLLHEDTERDGVVYRVVDPSTIALHVSAEDPAKNADVCILPVTAASKLFGDGKTYRMLGLVTQGNLYLVSKNSGNAEDRFVYTAENLSELSGKVVLAAQMNEVPGLTLKAVLDRAGVAWQEISAAAGASSEKVNLIAAASEYDCELLAEPGVSMRLGGGAGWRVVGDLQALYGEVYGESYGESYASDDKKSFGFPQAAIVAKSAFIAENEEWTKEFLKKLGGAAEWLYSTDAQTVYTAVVSHFADANKKPVFAAEYLTAQTLERCGVRFDYARDCKQRVNGYLTGLKNVRENSVKIPDAEFYWDGIVQ